VLPPITTPLTRVVFLQDIQDPERSMGVADLGLNGVLYLPLTRYTLAGSVPMHTQDFPASIKISKVTILRV